MTANPPLRVPAVDAAVMYRRLQLAQSLLGSWGTRVRHGHLMGLDLGPGVLQRPQPLGRALGLADAGWLDHALALCHRRTRLLHLGAPDGHLAAGLLHAGLVAGASVWPADAEAGQRLHDDAVRHAHDGQRLQCLPGDSAAAQASSAGLLAGAPHVLCVADSAARLADWLQAVAASDLARWTVVCPAPSPSDAPQAEALQRLHALLGDAGWQALTADPQRPVPPEVDALDATDRALVLGETGAPRWWCATGAQVAQRRRTLLCTHAGDHFVARLLDTLRRDVHEPLAVDVLQYSLAGEPAAGSVACPSGVRLFRLPTVADAQGVHAVDGALVVHDAGDRPVGTVDSFFDGYAQFAVWSINGGNAGLLQWLAAVHGRERIQLLVSDDEVDLRYRVQQVLQTGGAQAEAAVRPRYPAALERAFDAVRHFWVPRQPWEPMLRFRRSADLQVHGCLLPIDNDLSAVGAVRAPDDCYVLMLHPKPSLRREEAMAQLDDFLQRWQVDRPLRVLTLRNDMATSPLALPGGRGTAQLRVYPAPLPSHVYFELMAGCHGLVLVPRGGMTSTRDAVRLGLDIFDDGSAFSPNCTVLRDEVGLHVHARLPITRLHDGRVNTPAQRETNQRRLAACEHDAIARLRRTLL